MRPLTIAAVAFVLLAVVSTDALSSAPKLSSPVAGLPRPTYVEWHASTTATAAIQRAIDSGAAEVVVPFVGKPWIVEPIRLRSNLILRLEPGVRLEAKPDAFKGKEDAMLICHEVETVSIIGYGATLHMRKDDYLSDQYELGEWRHTIDLRGSKHVTISGLTTEASGGDGVYIGPTWDVRRVPCEDITVRNCRFSGSLRQGVSVTSANGVRIENCVFSGTSGRNPQAGLDLEPSNPRDRLSNIHILNCTSEGNSGSGFIVALSRLNSLSKSVSVLFENCLARNCQAHMVQSSVGKDPPRGLVEFRRCVFEKTPKAGLRVVWKSAPDQFALRFTNCKWQDIATRYSRGPFSLDLVPAGAISATGGLEFIGCELYGYDGGSFMDIRGLGFHDVKGQIQVHEGQGVGSKRTVPNTKLVVYHGVYAAGTFGAALKTSGDVQH